MIGTQGKDRDTGVGIKVTDDYHKQSKRAQFVRATQTDVTTSQHHSPIACSQCVHGGTLCVLSGGHHETVFTQRLDAQPALCCLSDVMTDCKALSAT